jgi:hypothetical protein
MHMTDLTPEDVQQKLVEAVEKLRSGELVVGPEEQHPLDRCTRPTPTMFRGGAGLGMEV